MTAAVTRRVIGKWRIVEADLWDRGHLDLVGPAHITFHGHSSAELNDDGTLNIEFRYHLGDEAKLKARPW